MPEYGKEELTTEVQNGLNDHVMVHLVTVQPHNITDRLLNGNPVSCDPQLSSFKYYAWAKYDWIASEMDRVGIYHQEPNHARWPMWAWASPVKIDGANGNPLSTMIMDSDKRTITINDLLLLEVPADRLLFSSFDDWSAWPFITYSGIAQPPDKIAEAMTMDENLQYAWFDLSDCSTSAERKSTWWRCERSLSTVINSCSTNPGDLYDHHNGCPARPIIQACLWEIMPVDVIEVISPGDHRYNLTDRSILDETVYKWLRKNGRP